jgi:hypothetical protein
MATDRKNVPFIENISYLMSVKRLGKSLMVWATSPFDKS